MYAGSKGSPLIVALVPFTRHPDSVSLMVMTILSGERPQVLCLPVMTIPVDQPRRDESAPPQEQHVDL
jgi:hypothetical protein